MDTKNTPRTPSPSIVVEEERQHITAVPPRAVPETDLRWVEPYHLLIERAIEVADTDGHKNIPHLGKAPLPVDPAIIEGKDTDWAVMNLSDDPLWKKRSHFPVPNRVTRRLNEIERAGTKFDNIVSAHEIPKDALEPGDPVPLELVLPPPHPRAVRVAQRLGYCSRAAWSPIALPFSIIFAVGAEQKAASAKSRSRAASVKRRLYDPILFGVQTQSGVKVQSGDIVDWFFLCRWIW